MIHFFIRLVWYANMVIFIVYVLRQQPKLKGINNINTREKGFSLSSTKEKSLLRQTWLLVIFFISFTITIGKLID